MFPRSQDIYNSQYILSTSKIMHIFPHVEFLSSFVKLWNFILILWIYIGQAPFYLLRCLTIKFHIMERFIPLIVYPKWIEAYHILYTQYVFYILQIFQAYIYLIQQDGSLFSYSWGIVSSFYSHISSTIYDPIIFTLGNHGGTLCFATFIAFVLFLISKD